MLYRRISQAFEAFKFLLAFILAHTVCIELNKKKLWLITEKTIEARDNGYHLFIYLRKNYPELPVYYAITKDSPDLVKIKEYGNIIPANSLKHYIYFLCAKNSISSQPGGARPDSSGIINHFKKCIRKDQHIIFLQHGITTAEHSHSFDYLKTNYSLFVCSAEKEKLFIQETYGYPSNVAQNIGLCRFDALPIQNNKSKKQILVMPTFRKWLVIPDRTREATKQEKKNFMQSNYYRVYSSLLRDEKLLKILQQHNYKLVFYPHYMMQPFVHCFDNYASKVIEIADRENYDVQKLLINSAVLITDYSSVFFDFAFMEKPEIYFQFDKKDFHSNHYNKGYFEYERDGFGPVCESIENVVSYIDKLFINECIIEDVYKTRIYSFFNNRDHENCKRTYEAINKLEG